MPGQCRLPRLQIDPILMRKILCDHGAVESHETASIRKVGEKSSDIAVANENLGTACNSRQIERIEQVVRPIPTTGTDDGTDIVPLEHFLQFVRPPLMGTGKIWIPLENGIEVEGFVSKFA